MHTPGGDWAQAVLRYLASKEGAGTSAYAAQQLRAQDGAAMGWLPKHGLEGVHKLRVMLEGWSSQPVQGAGDLAPLTQCREILIPVAFVLAGSS
jgi:hypothetical protein